MTPLSVCTYRHAMVARKDNFRFWLPVFACISAHSGGREGGVGWRWKERGGGGRESTIFCFCFDFFLFVRVFVFALSYSAMLEVGTDFCGPFFVSFSPSSRISSDFKQQDERLLDLLKILHDSWKDCFTSTKTTTKTNKKTKNTHTKTQTHKNKNKNTHTQKQKHKIQKQKH